MAIYQTKRYLIDSVNHLELKLGSYIETECLTWVNRFGSDLLLVEGDGIGAGYIPMKLTGLAEELLETPMIQDEVVEAPVMEELLSSSVVGQPPKKVPRKKTVT